MTLSRYILILMLLASLSGTAQPDFAESYLTDGVALYRDSSVKSTFYYLPYGLQLVKNEAGKPDFIFLQMRYTGTRLAQDQGSQRFKSLLRFRLANRAPSAAKRERIKKLLEEKGIRIDRLQPLPIQHLKATLIHNGVNDSVTKAYGGGFFEGGETHPANVYWTERDYILRLSNEDAQLFNATLRGKQPTLSINYTYSAKGVNDPKGKTAVSVSGEFPEEMKIHPGREKKSAAATLTEKIVLSGALSITIDIEKWPDLIRQTDINERIPPEYAALDVYCYDFNNGIREDLYARVLDIKATGVGGKEVEFSTTFRAAAPDIYAQTIKFIYAVRPDKPYAYRITEIANNGKQQRSGWRTLRNWHQVLDITSQSQNHNNK